VAFTEIDRSLLKRTLANEPGAWKDFVDRFIGLFVHVINHTAHARSARLRPEDVDDLCSEIFLTLVADDFAVLRQFRGEASLATYLTVIARRIAVREMSQRRKAEALGHVNARHSSLQNAEANTAAEHRIDDLEEVQRLLEGLPGTDAEVVRQYHLEGKSYRDISSGLGIPINSIGPTLSRARKRMRGSKARHSVG
jgi:RNA polymerase sigma-70 factor (ECF subfamily)